MSRSGDTIFALATPPGRSAIAVLRISGPAAHEAPALFGAKCPPPGHYALARLYDGDATPIDEVLLLAMRGPNSSTGEDVLEIHCHGSVAVTSYLLEHLSKAMGFVPAGPGDFTHQMFANDKIDLLGVEGLADLIDSETDLQRSQAWRQMSGALYRPVIEWRERLIRLGAHLEALIDFAEEDLPEEVEKSLRADADALKKAMEVVLDDGGFGERVRSGITLALLGPVNAGKSTLLNHLAGRDAAIVSAQAGTTRDIVSVRIDLDGIAVTLLDTAGVRDTENDIEAEGVRRALAAAKNADGALIVVDASLAGWRDEADDLTALCGGPYRLVLNKADKGVHPEASIRPDASIKDEPSIDGSDEARQRQAGINVSLLDAPDNTLASDNEPIINALRELVIPANNAGGASIITRQRHRHAIEETAAALTAAMAHDFATAPEMAAEDLRRAADALGRITGIIDVEELLGNIFSSFCIGK
ncbi:tRNA uridine-5-carboxymethylaminomethyl(34) synthesis GTPase MnmE [Alphaproteobacteria bacterium]|nr:tRNA uridine-5-carboxymethylaminomethyl(34) synthesis GTPase MnmE [Alphaproteobacteria bacterium]